MPPDLDRRPSGHMWIIQYHLYYHDDIIDVYCSPVSPLAGVRAGYGGVSSPSGRVSAAVQLPYIYVLAEQDVGTP